MTAALLDRAHEVGGKRDGALQQRDDSPRVVDLRGETFGEFIDPRGDVMRFEKNAQARLSRQ
jgi:hypothetical protein